MNTIRKFIITVGMMSAVFFMTACEGLQLTSGSTAVSPPRANPTKSSTPTGFLPILTVATIPILLANGDTFQAVVVTRPSLCGDREVSTTALVYGQNDEIVSSGTSSTSGANTCGKLLPPLATASAAVVAASKVSSAIRSGSSELAGAVRDGSSTLAGSVDNAADGLQSVGDGLSANADLTASMMAKMQCQALGNPVAIAQCIAALPQ